MTASTLKPHTWRRTLVNGATGRLALGILLIWLIISGQGLAGWLTSGDRVDPSLRTGEPVNVVVVLDFDPERFHNEQLARYGVFSGRDGGIRRFRLRNVSPENLDALAGLVWVERVEPMQ
ncbi:hypothetical protein [Pelagibacterium montanilacus]|uniref:hypothetical protein n=1 Tax=Pelagibacterium montanilacus TaxID=2185280 RepID=UPI000F8F1027|nr:hypothetical protein [Pelagibacterium montanilacus]